MPDDFLDALSISERETMWRQTLEGLSGDRTVQVAENDGVVAKDNARARAFYERRAWSWGGAVGDNDALGAHVTEYRYRKTIERLPPQGRLGNQ